MHSVDAAGRLYRGQQFSDGDYVAIQPDWFVNSEVFSDVVRKDRRSTANM